MIHRLSVAILLGWALLAAHSVHAQDVFDPRDYRSQVDGQKTQILVLGALHLSGTPEDWDPVVLEPLLTKLQAFRPDVITIEALSGEAISQLWDYRGVHGDTATSYGSQQMLLSASGSLGTGMEMAEAEAEARSALLNWPSSPTAAQRRRLTALLATAGDPYSALVQWWRLDPSERLAQDGVSRTLTTQLNDLEKRRNENHLIGSRLAARLGLERVFPTDAQDEDVFTPDQSAEFGRSVFPPMLEIFNADPLMVNYANLSQQLLDGPSTLEAFRTANSPEVGRRQADIEWLGVIDRPTEGRVGRVRMAGWEVRNLRMTANIREASARAPGGRVLVIVGAGHKQWLEAYLGMMSDVELVDARSILQ